MKPVFDMLALCLLGTAGVGWIVFPTRTFQNLLGEGLGNIFSQYSSFLIFASCAGALFFYFLGKIYERKENVGTKGFQKTHSTRIGLAVLVLAGAVIVRAWIGMDNPFVWDENRAAVMFIGASIADYLTPFQMPREPNPGQFLATASSILSMRLLGPSEFSVRLPSLLWSILLVVILVWQGRKTYGNWVLFGLLLYLYFNESVIFYMSNTSGYAGVLFASTVVFLSLNHALLSSKKTTTCWLVCFVVGAIASFLFHTFGAIFFIILLFATTLWACLHRASLSEVQLHNLKRAIRWFFALTPIAAFVLYRHFLLMAKYKNFNAGGDSSPVQNIITALGVHETWALKALVLLYAAHLLYVILYRRRESVQLASCFSISAIVLFSGVLATVVINQLASRYFLVFVVPLGLSFFELAAAVQWKRFSRTMRFATAAMVAAIVGIGGHTLYFMHISYNYRYTAFIREVESNISSHSCLRVSGEPHEGLWARNFYFRGNNHEACEPDYVVHFERARYSTTTWPNPWTHQENLQLLFEDTRGRHLYKVVKN